MGRIVTAICNSFKSERQRALHDLTAHTLKIALIKPSPTGSYGAASTNYSELAGDEVTGTGYTAGGVTLTGAALTLDGDVCVFDFDDPTWAGATFSARGAIIYNASAGNRAIAVFDFGETKSVLAGTFTLQLPLPTASIGLIRSA